MKQRLVLYYEKQQTIMVKVNQLLMGDGSDVEYDELRHYRRIHRAYFSLQRGMQLNLCYMNVFDRNRRCKVFIFILETLEGDDVSKGLRKYLFLC